MYNNDEAMSQKHTETNSQEIKLAPKTKEYKFQIRAFVVATVLTVVCLLAGVLTHYDRYYVSVWWEIGFGAAFVLHCVIQLILYACFKRRIKRKKAADIRAIYLDGKSAATDNERKFATAIKLKYVACRLYIWLFFIFCLLCAFVGGFTSTGIWLSILLAWPGLIAVIPFLFIEDYKPKGATDGTLSQQDYPEIYAVVNRATKAVGIKKAVYIFVSDEGMASVFDCKDCYIVELGAPLIALLNDEELYAVLLHELRHLKDIYYGTRELQQLSITIQQKQSNKLYRLFSRIFFGHILASFAYSYNLYAISAAEGVEYRADKAMVKYGNNQVAADALVKVDYISMYDYEHALTAKNRYVDKTADKNMVTDATRDFLQEVAARKEEWLGLLGKELSIQGSSHPLCKDRIAVMGAEMRQVDCPTFDEISEERKRILAATDKRLADVYSEKYDEMREAYYLEPQKQVEKWLAAGKPDMKERNRETINSLMQLNMIDQAMELCDKLIADKSSGYAHAYLVRGMYRLHVQNNPDGIDDMYAAVEVNDNYGDEALGEIAMFCCRNGLQQQLEEVRRKTDELVDNEDDRNKLYKITGRDEVEYEPLQGNRRQEIVDYIASVDDGSIAEVYLIRKKLGNKFCSPFIVRFKDDANIVSCNAIMSKIFEFLDNLPEDWNYSLNIYNGDTASAVKKVPDSLVYSGKNSKNTSSVAQVQLLRTQIAEMNKQIASETRVLKFLEVKYSMCQTGIYMVFLGLLVFAIGLFMLVKPEYYNEKAFAIGLVVGGIVLFVAGKYLAYRLNLLNIEQGFDSMMFLDKLVLFLLSVMNGVKCNKKQYARIKTIHEEKLSDLMKQQSILREKFDKAVNYERQISATVTDAEIVE